jgi:uncharacterized protein (DUF1697 family)
MTRNRHVALLRGINVGRAKRVAMADLRELVEGLGFTEVRTLLNSGNVVFTAPASAVRGAGARIEKALVAKTGVAARVTVLGGSEFERVVADNPLIGVARDPSRLLVSVLHDPADRTKLAALAKKRWAPDALALGERVAYLWCASGVLESPVSVEVARALGDRVTARNWATITKLHALVSPDSGERE